jgi:hypothetical protein
MEKKLAASKACASKTIFSAFNTLKENNNEMPIKDLIDKIGKTINLTDWEKERYVKTGYIR